MLMENPKGYKTIKPSGRFYIKNFPFRQINFLSVSMGEKTNKMTSFLARTEKQSGKEIQ